MLERRRVITNIRYLLGTDYVALLGQRGVGVKTLVRSLITDESSNPGMSFISVALPNGMHHNDEFIDILIERFREVADKVPSVNNLAEKIVEVIEKNVKRSADYRLRKVIDLLGKETTATYLVIVFYRLAEAPEAPLRSLLQLLRDYHNQRQDIGTAGEKLRFLVVGGLRLWHLCCYKTDDTISPFNIARRVFLDGCSREELLYINAVKTDEEAFELYNLTAGIPLFVKHIVDGTAGIDNLFPYFSIIQNYWNALPVNSQEVLRRTLDSTELFSSCYPDFDCPQIPEVAPPWLEIFWAGFLRLDKGRLNWRSIIYREFVLTKYHSQGNLTQSFQPSNFPSFELSAMNPEDFLEQRDVVPLTKALYQFAEGVPVASDRQDILRNAGIDPPLLIQFDKPANMFAQALVAAFKSYRMSSSRLGYHPMVSLLEHLCGLAFAYNLAEQDIALFDRLVEQGYRNFNALVARSAVGRIESPQGKGIGTGTLVSRNLLLTCNHIFSKTQIQKAWVRFGYKEGSYGLEDVFELDLNFLSSRNHPDHALLQIKGSPSLQPILPSEAILDGGQSIRLIHHPLGKPVVVSDLGEIMQVGEDYIDHNLITDEGSSGSPIFNGSWELVALHQGFPGIGRSVIKGTVGGIPIHAIWQQISPYLI